MSIHSAFSTSFRDWFAQWSADLFLKSVLLVGLVAGIIHYATKRYLENRVSGILTNHLRQYPDAGKQADTAFGVLHGCQPPPELPTRWPLGIDRIKELWSSNSEGRLLAFLCSIAKDYEPRNTLSQYLLVGPRAYHNLNPANVESILSTNFTGSPPCNGIPSKY